MTDDDILALLRQALEKALDEKDRPVFDADLPLTGPGAVLDSYEMLAFLVETDFLLGEPADIDLTVAVSLPDGRLSLDTIGTLAAHIAAEIHRKREQA
jgi:hypothetical protein